MTNQYLVRSARPGDVTVTAGMMEASNEAELRSRLQSEGIAVLSIRAKKSAHGAYQGSKSARVRQSYPVFCREVRTLIHAGMTIVEAVDTLCARERIEGKAGSLAAMLLTGLERGQSLSTALTNLPGTPTVLIAAVRAGERTSNLAAALEDYLRYDELVEQLRRKIVSAAIYPGLVTGLGVAIALFLLMVVMPKFAHMYQNLRSNAEVNVSAVIQVSQFVAQHQLLVLGGLAALLACATIWVAQGGAKRLVLKIGNAIPWVKQRLQDFDLAMLYQALALLLRGGYPLTEALMVAEQAALNPDLRAAVHMASQRIERGESVSQSFADARLCDEVGRRLMAAAERNGDFHAAADVVSHMHGQRFELFVERVTRIVEPVLLIAVTLMVGSIVIVMYQPVFDMATQLR